MSTLRERALRLLARREQARAELVRKLSPYSESADELDVLLNDLEARGLLSDERYAEARMHTRAARFGNARLAYELRTQGVSDTLVDQVLATCGDELARARQVWQRKFGGRSDGDSAALNDPNERSRQIRFLTSRGFSGETIRRVLRGDFEDD